MNLATLGLMRKTGALITGFDAVVREMKAPVSAVQGIALTLDLSPKSSKEIIFLRDKFCPKLQIIRLNADMEQVGAIIGRKTGIVAVTDAGFWRLLAEGCEQI